MIQGVSLLRQGALPGPGLYNQLAQLLKYARCDRQGITFSRDPATGGLLLHLDPSICPDQTGVQEVVEAGAGPIIGRITAQNDGLHIEGARAGLSPQSLVISYADAFPQSNVLYPVWLLAYGAATGQVYDVVRGAPPRQYKFFVGTVPNNGNIAATLYQIGTVVTSATNPAASTQADVTINQLQVFPGAPPTGAIPAQNWWTKHPGSSALGNDWRAPWTCQNLYTSDGYKAQLYGGVVLVYRTTSRKFTEYNGLVGAAPVLDIPATYADNTNVYLWGYLQGWVTLRIGVAAAADVPADATATRKLGTLCHAEYGGEAFGVWLPNISGDVILQIDDAN